MQKQRIQRLSLIINPIRTLSIFFFIVRKKLYQEIYYLKNHFIAAFIFSLFVILCILPGHHQQIAYPFFQIGYFSLYWILLGIASSIGLGTGLHTFVLYTGPHIAKVAIASYQCKYVPHKLPTRWQFEYFSPCSNLDSQASFINIYIQVYIQAFLWGLGTALGQLPPYLIARAARKSSGQIQQLNEIENNNSIINKIKKAVYKQLQKHSFITVLLFASIPNPLFDLAGLTCGHFGVSFLQFFIPTFIGKAIIKVNIQTAFIIFLFQKEFMDWILNGFENLLPKQYGQKIEKIINEQKSQLYSPKILQKKTLLSTLWQILIVIMIAYFIKTLIENVVHNYRVTQKQQSKRNQIVNKYQNKKQN